MTRLKRFIFTTALSSVAALSLMNCKDAPSSRSLEMVDFVHQVSDLSVDENILYGTLDNGLRYAILNNDTPSQTASIRMRFGTGSLNDAPGTEGLAHFLEHMAFNGSKNLPEGEMTKTLERYGLAFGADTNAYTSFDETVYMLDLPSVSEEIFDVTLGIMRETASNLTLNQGAIDRERGVVKSEKRNRESAAYRAQIAYLDFFLGESMIPKRLPIGTNVAIDSMGKPDFEAYYQGRYRPENTFLVVVGDADPDFLKDKIEHYFNDWAPVGEALPQVEAGQAVKTGFQVGYFSDPEIQTSLEIGLMRPYEEKLDNAQTRRQSIIDSLGNAILNRRLQTLALSESAPFISASASTNGVYKVAESTSMSVNCSPENWSSAMDAAQKEIRKAVKYGFSSAELKEQVVNLRKSIEVSVQTAETRRTPSLAGMIVGGFANETVVTTPQSALDRFEGYVDGITQEEVLESFKLQWDGIETPLIWLQTGQEIDDPQMTIKQAYEQSLAVEVTAPEVIEEVEFAYKDFGKAGKVISRDEVKELGITQVKFANNVRLNVKKTDFQKESISIQVSFGGGTLSLPKSDPHVQQLAGYAVMAGGLRAHSDDELKRILAGKAVGASFSAGTERFVLSGGTVPDDFADQMNLMAAYFVAPGFRPESEARYDNYIASWYPTLDSKPSGVASRDIPRILRSGDPRFGIPTQDEIIAPTMADVRNWVGPAFEAGAVEIGIVGDVDVDRAIAQVARTFGALPQRQDIVPSYDAARKISFPLSKVGSVTTLRHAGPKNRSLLRIYWPAPDGREPLRDRRMEMLERVFGLRVLDVIREQEGAAYSPSTFRYNAQAYPHYGFFGASLDLDTQDVTKMQSIVEDIASEFAAGHMTEDEFERAKTPVLEIIETSLESNGYWMGLLDRAQTDEDIQNHYSRASDYQDMTLEDIKPLAAQIFGSGKGAAIQVLPQP